MQFPLADDRETTCHQVLLIHVRQSLTLRFHHQEHFYCLSATGALPLSNEQKDWLNPMLFPGLPAQVLSQIHL